MTLWQVLPRGDIEIWLPSRHEEPDPVIRILTRASGLSPQQYDDTNRPPDQPLDQILELLLEDEWAEVPGRSAMDTTPDRLELLVEITTQSEGVLSTETDRENVLGAVKRVTLALERLCEELEGYEGLGEEVRAMIDREALIRILQAPRPLAMQSTSRRPTYWWLTLSSPPYIMPFPSSKGHRSNLPPKKNQHPPYFHQ